MSLAQAEADSARATPTQIQNVQRLLKLLADRYPNKYGSIDPGRVDGSFGAETKDAIRNFRKISGSKSDAQHGDQLVADILAALAQMSATQAAEPAPSARPPAAPKLETPKIEAPKIETATEAAAEKPAAPSSNAAAAKSAATDAPKAQKPKAAAAADKSRRVYFVQAASLKSLESAKREWRRIFEENRAALTGEQVYFEKANVADRGLFFRILIGPMSEKDAAKTLCAFLRQNGQTCVVTSRNPADLQRTANQPEPAAKAEQDPSGAPDRGGTAVVPAPVRTKAGATEASDAPERGQDAAQPPASSTPPSSAPAAPAESSAPNASQDPAAAGPVAADVSKPAVEPKEPETPAPDGAAAMGDGKGQAVEPAPASAPTEAAAPAFEPEPGRADNIQAPPQATVSEPQSDATGAVVLSEPKPVTPRPNAAMDAARTVITALSQQPDRVAGIAAALIVATGAAVYGWRRRNRRLSLNQLFQSTSLPFAQSPSESAGPMDAIETDFGSDSLRASRLARDAFLRETLGAETDDESAVRSDDSAIRINSSLKALLVKEPAQYKSIFLNWIFLAKVGAALNNKEISFEQLSDHVSREFDLLQTYFKIHLLELDDRHRIRQELPGLFYCLQLTQMKKRQSGAKYSVA